MKRLVAILLVIAMMVSIGSIGAFAVEEEQANIDTTFIKEAEYQKDESGAFVFTLNSDESNFRLFSTEKQFKNEIMVIQPLTPEDAAEIEANIIALRASGSGSRELSSSLSGAVVAYLTIYYSFGTDNGKDTVWLTKITGRYTADPQKAFVTGQWVTSGQTGLSPSGVVSQSQDDYPSANNWTLYPQSSWKPIYDVKGGIQTIGAYYTVYYNVGSSQGGASTSVSVSNNYLG